MKMFTEEREVKAFFDLHGHSRKMNAFLYGCSFTGYEYENRNKNALIRAAPLLFSQKNRFFSFKDCTFRYECYN